jgi:hypothetical protein
MRSAVAVPFDGGQPTHGIVNLVGSGETVVTGQPAVRAGTNAGVVTATPVGQIVTALGAGLGMVGNLIGGKAGRGGQFLRQFKKRHAVVFVGGRHGVMKEGCSGLDGELVERQVIAGKFKQAAQFVPPLRFSLAWPRVDEVKGHALKNLASLGHGNVGLGSVVASAQETERVVV